MSEVQINCDVAHLSQGDVLVVKLDGKADAETRRAIGEFAIRHGCEALILEGGSTFEIRKADGGTP